MTVSNTAVQQTYVCNGVTTTFAIPFQWFDLTQITVYKVLIATGVPTQLVVNTDYIYNDPTTPTTVQTVDGDGDPLALPNTYKLIIARSTPRTQIVDYINNGEFKAEDHERGMDRIVMELQEAAYEADNAIKLSPLDSSVDAVLPPMQASSVIASNADGDGFEYQSAADFKGEPGDPGAPGADGADGANGANGVGVPTGGTANQILTKINSTDFNTKWADPAVSVPTTTKGDISGQDASGPQRVAVGSDGQSLHADSTAATGVRWVTPTAPAPTTQGTVASPVSVAPGTGVTGSTTAWDEVIVLNSNAAGDDAQPVTANPQISGTATLGRRKTLLGANNTNVLQFVDGNGLKLNGPWNASDSAILELLGNGSVWVERSRSTV